MPVSIKLRRSSVQGQAPTTSNLLLGELAINTNDGVAYLKRSTSGNETGAGTSIVQLFNATGGAITGDVTLNAQSDLRFADSDSSNWVAFQAPATVSANVTWTLPSTDGTSGQVLSTNGSGTLSWATASGGGGGTKTLAVFTPLDNQPPATAFATLDTRNSIAVLDFDAGTDESAVFCGVIPEGATLTSGLIVRIHWMATTATADTCRWGVQFEKSGTDLDADSFDTATEASGTANGTSGIETMTSITATAIDSLAAGDRFRLKVFRNADDATNDTMTGDAELIAVEVRSAA